MNNDLFINSIRVLQQNWKLIFAIIACVAWGVLLVFAILKKITKQSFTDTEITALALGGWPIPLLLLSLLIIFLKVFISATFLIYISLFLTVISTGFAIIFVWNKASLNILPFIFISFVFVRLGFAAEIILPPYFDSAEHYRIIRSLLNTSSIFSEGTYYHIGYHVILTAFILITHQSISQSMLLFGQVILAAIPFPIYFFVLRTTNSHKSALFGVLLAAFGWFMPAHAVNWGKYPALLSLLLIQFTLGMALIKNHRLFILSLIISVLIHTRSIILIAIILGAWTASIIWAGQSRNKGGLFFGFVGLLLGLVTLLIKQNQILGPILEPYQIWATLLVGLLSALVFRSFPQLIFFSALSMVVMLAGMFIPITSTITLLDRPLVEMILFLPLAFLGGLGLTRVPKFIIPILMAAILINAWALYDFSPSSCCQLAGRDDAVAMDWIDKNLPADARIAIASADLMLNSFGMPMQNTGTDAGIWVTPLTHRATLSLPYAIRFAEPNTYALLCKMKITYIYVGIRQQSFNTEFVTANPALYEFILFLPNAKIVHVLGCESA